MSKLPVPKDVLAQHVAILGKTRSGKSSVMRLLVEDLLERKQPVCIVDPKGDWWGIKLAADGKSPGYPVVIFGGEHADIPITETNGAQVAELFATGNRPCLVDLGGWMVGARTRFWIDFASTLFKLTKGHRWLAVDEFHNFAPKGRIEDPNAGKMLHWSNRLSSEGLGKGLALLFASQRPQKVHNDSLTSAETLIAMRVLHPSDRGAVSDWIKGCGDADGSQVLNSLAQMERGEGWAWSPEIGFGPKRVKFPLFETYDSFRAQSAEDARKIKGWAEVDLDEVRQKFSAAIERTKADDPKELRRQIAVLQQEKRALERGSPVAPPKEKIVEKRVEVPVLKDGQLARIEAATQKMGKLVGALGEASIVLSQLGGGIQEAIRSTRAPGPGMSRPLSPATPHPPTRSAIPDRQPVAPRVTRMAPADQRVGVGGSELTRMQRAILTALAQHPEGLTKRKVLLHTGYRSSGPVSTAFADLARAGWVQTEGNALVITAEGLGALGAFEPLPAGDALRHELLTGGKLSLMERRLLAAACGAFPDPITKGEILARAQYASSGPVSTAFGRLVGYGYLEAQGPSRVRAWEGLFG